MRRLRFVGLTSLDESGSPVHALHLRDDEHEYVVPVDDRVVQAVRRTHGWVERGTEGTSGTPNGEGQVDGPVETQTQDLPPREIQSRVRAGESPEQIARAAGVDVDRIARFARPVLQEREHIADAAQRVVVRTGALDGPLGEVVRDRLAGVFDDPAESWDSWRRDDGRWTIALNFRDDVQERIARWSFDPSTNSVTVDDETARWLTEGTSPQAPTQAPTLTPVDPRRTRPRRLLSVPDVATDEADLESVESVETPESRPTIEAAAAYDEDEIADELAALGLQPATPREEPQVQAELDLEPAIDIAPVVDAAPRTEAAPVVDAEPVIEAEPVVEAAPVVDAEPVIEAEPVVEAAAVSRPAAETKPAKKPRKSAKRASVPSWDDIVFGARKSPE